MLNTMRVKSERENEPLMVQMEGGVAREEGGRGSSRSAKRSACEQLYLLQKGVNSRAAFASGDRIAKTDRMVKVGMMECV